MVILRVATALSWSLTYFLVDYAVYGPNELSSQLDKVILSGEKEKQGDYVFTVNVPGEHRFCFDNTISTFAEKIIDFEITVENDLAPGKWGRV